MSWYAKEPVDERVVHSDQDLWQGWPFQSTHFDPLTMNGTRIQDLMDYRIEYGGNDTLDYMEVSEYDGCEYV